MDKLKQINLKKQLLSLKFCYENLLIENKVLTSQVHNLELLFKQTKQYTKKKNISNIKFDFNFKNDKKYQNILLRRVYLIKNVEKQNNTLIKSILFNKFNELQKEKEYLTQTLEEKNNNLNMVQEELKIYKKYNPYNYFSKYKKLKSSIYLNEILDTPLLNRNNKENNNINNTSIINQKFKKEIFKDKIDKKKLLEKSKSELKNLYDYSIYNFKKRIKEYGFHSTIKNNKNNKTYIISVEPNKLTDANSSASISDSDNYNNISESNSIDERLFIDNFHINKKIRDENKYNKIKNKIFKDKNRDETLFNLEFHSLKTNHINNQNPVNSEIYVNLASVNNTMFNNNITEINDERINELNTKLLTIKEKYYNCLDSRYQLKSSLKENISLIYKTKERIKKIKKQKNLK